MTAVNYASYALIHGLPPAAQPALRARNGSSSSSGDLLGSLGASTPATPTTAAAASGAPAADDDDHLTFGDLLDVVNPLQHIPVVGTLYRAITGDTIKTLPKIAGDALYGGWMGLASSVADTAFEKITGKNVGDTILGYAEDLLGLDKPQLTAPGLKGPTPVDFAALSVATPSVDAPQAVASTANATPVPGQDALMQAMDRNGVSQDVALRAAAAYRQSLNAQPLRSALN
jgi:hypothetical protein